MFNIILYQPEIPPNTGNIIRLSANIGAQLHLIKPMGFVLEDKALRRAGLDYHEFANIQLHDTLQDCLKVVGKTRVFACSTKGTQNYAEVGYQKNDSFLFGPETRGLPAEVLAQFTVIRIPMQPNCRSLNLSNSVAVIVYEAWRQLKFS